MTHRTPYSFRRILIVAVTVLVLTGAVGYLVLLNRDVEPSYTLITSLPESIVLGKRYPVEIEATLPWHSRPEHRMLTVGDDFLAVGKTWSFKKPGPGWSTWTVTVLVVCLETGPGKRGTVEVGLDDYKKRFPLGPCSVTGLLKPGESFTPTLSDYQPTTTGTPYALWGALLFGALAVGGVLVSIMLPGKQPKPASPGMALSQFMDELEHSDAPDVNAAQQQLSDRVRAYIVQVWQLPVTTQSTDELLHMLDAGEEVPPAVREAITNYLKQADVVKYNPATDDASISRHLEAARTLLDISEHHASEATHDA